MTGTPNVTRTAPARGNFVPGRTTSRVPAMPTSTTGTSAVAAARHAPRRSGRESGRTGEHTFGEGRQHRTLVQRADQAINVFTGARRIALMGEFATETPQEGAADPLVGQAVQAEVALQSAVEADRRACCIGARLGQQLPRRQEQLGTCGGAPGQRCRSHHSPWWPRSPSAPSWSAPSQAAPARVERPPSRRQASCPDGTLDQAKEEVPAALSTIG